MIKKFIMFFCVSLFSIFSNATTQYSSEDFVIISEWKQKYGIYIIWHQVICVFPVSQGTKRETNRGFRFYNTITHRTYTGIDNSFETPVVTSVQIMEDGTLPTPKPCLRDKK